LTTTESPSVVLSAPPATHGRARRRRSLPGWLVASASVTVLLGIWWTVAALEIWDPVFVPSPAAVWGKLIETSTIHDGRVGYAGDYLWEHLWVSLRRILTSALIATVVGIPIGLAIGLVPVVRQALSPLITFLRQLPPLAYFSLLIIWFGIDETPKQVLLVVAAMPPIIVATASGIEGVAQGYIDAARSLGARRIQLVRRILVPGALPEIFTGIRLGVGVAYTSVVAAETVNGMPGIGGMIRDAQRYNQTDVVILGILVLGLSGLVLEYALLRIQKWATPWRGRV